MALVPGDMARVKVAVRYEKAGMQALNALPQDSYA